MSQMTQLQHFYESHRRMSDTLQHCTWMAGLSEDNPNPMTWDEVKAAAESKKPYAWAFQMIVAARDEPSPVDLLIMEAAEEDALAQA